MGAGRTARRVEPAQHVGDVPVRSVSYEDVLDARWDITMGQLLDRVIRPEQGFEVSLREMNMGLVRFRSRAYRYANSRGWRAHVVKTQTAHLVRIYSHDDQEDCDLCKDTPPQRA